MLVTKPEVRSKVAEDGASVVEEDIAVPVLVEIEDSETEFDTVEVDARVVVVEADYINRMVGRFLEHFFEPSCEITDKLLWWVVMLLMMNLVLKKHL